MFLLILPAVFIGFIADVARLRFIADVVFLGLVDFCIGLLDNLGDFDFLDSRRDLDVFWLDLRALLDGCLSLKGDFSLDS